MEQYALYLVLKDIASSISSDFRYSFNDMDINGKDVVGIYIKGAEPSKYRDVSSGGYYNEVARVQFLIQGDLTNESLMKVLSTSTKIKKALIHTFNRVKKANSQIRYKGGEVEYNLDKTDVTEEERVEVMIVKVDLIGEVDFKGKTGQGMPRYSINFRVQYKIGGN